jgi:exopolyphosphatase/guanosine-5'-triphosphate,3'-diphosphate pyrophosphatase
MAVARIHPGRAQEARRSAIIDIGSNSIRLVVYQGLARVPDILLNEKVMAGLGRNMTADGHMAEESVAVALEALRRFALLASAMQVDRIRAVATAAVREAANGPIFRARVRAETGLDVEVIDGETEARGSALGVLAGIPDADGVMGDLGGGSLELVDIAGGEPRARISLPIGALRLDDVRRRSRRALGGFIEDALERVKWADAGRGRPFYAVGGSWRALAQLHMHMVDWPLPVIHQHVMGVDVPARLVRMLASANPARLRDIPNLSTSRLPQLPGAALLLRAVTRRLGSSQIIASATGLREGLLFDELPDALKKQDPLIEAARAEAQRSGRFTDGSNAAIGDRLLAWTDPLFATDPPADRRLRHAAALLADVAWRAHPDMRAERGLDVALHGSWTGIAADGRAMLATALWVLNGGPWPADGLAPLARLAPDSRLERARLWGLALRLGQRLGGGAIGPLDQSRLAIEDDRLLLVLDAGAVALYGESIARRHRSLAVAMELRPEVRTDDVSRRPRDRVRSG